MPRKREIGFLSPKDTIHPDSRDDKTAIERFVAGVWLLLGQLDFPNYMICAGNRR
jgi:hypothetical protein